MKLTVTVKKEVEVKTLVCDVEVRHWEDGKVDGVEDSEGTLMPCREGDGWKIIIDLASGKITNWKQGVRASVHYKVCDAGVYTLIDASGEVVKKVDGYVPRMLCPKENGHGDYIIMEILEDGTIEDFNPNLSHFREDED